MTKVSNSMLRIAAITILLTCIMFGVTDDVAPKTGVDDPVISNGGVSHQERYWFDPLDVRRDRFSAFGVILAAFSVLVTALGLASLGHHEAARTYFESMFQAAISAQVIYLLIVFILWFFLTEESYIVLVTLFVATMSGILTYIAARLVRWVLVEAADLPEPDPLR